MHVALDLIPGSDLRLTSVDLIKRTVELSLLRRSQAHGPGMRPKVLPQLLDEPQSLLRGKLINVDDGKRS